MPTDGSCDHNCFASARPSGISPNIPCPAGPVQRSPHYTAALQPSHPRPTLDSFADFSRAPPLVVLHRSCCRVLQVGVAKKDLAGTAGVLHLLGAGACVAAEA